MGIAPTDYRDAAAFYRFIGRPGSALLFRETEAAAGKSGTLLRGCFAVVLLREGGMVVLRWWVSDGLLIEEVVVG